MRDIESKTIAASINREVLKGYDVLKIKAYICTLACLVLKGPPLYNEDLRFMSGCVYLCF